jgi:hypothetical protein
MTKANQPISQADLLAMKDCLDQIERHCLTLNKLGGGMPVIEKNVRAIKSFVHALKFGVSDIADLER